MNKPLTIVLAMALAIAAASAQAACDYPRKIDLPNGNDATKDEMMAGQKAIKQYMEDMNTYLDCIAAEAEAAKGEDEAPEITAERNLVLSKRHNAAIDEMETLAAEFNTQVRAFKARSDQ